MKEKRDLVAEIQGRRKRVLRRAGRYEQFNRRHDELFEAVDLLAKYGGHEPVTRVELLKYIPIAIVACWEGYFRLLIRDLIDSGAPFRDNAARLETSRLDLPMLLAIGDRKISIGELLSHQVPLNSLVDINRSLSAVLGTDFLDLLKSTPDPENGHRISEIADKLFPDLHDIFEHRHIFCHELAVRVQPSIPSCRNALRASLVFTFHTEVLAQRLLGKDPPEI